MHVSAYGVCADSQTSVCAGAELQTQGLGLVKLVDGSQDVETVFQQTAAALEPTMHKEVLACTQALLEVRAITLYYHYMVVRHKLHV
jgi:hypothetical protein